MSLLWVRTIRTIPCKALNKMFKTPFCVPEEEGTDLCCVISSLVQIMLDPHYRTLTGFQCLVQKEWVAGCHAFLDRCNHLHQKEKEVVQSC